MGVNSLSSSLLNLVDDAIALSDELRVRELVLPAPGNNGHHKYAKFGLLILSDDSAGFFYRLPEPGEGGMVASLPSPSLLSIAADLRGAPITEVCKLILEKDNLSRGIGMASINAISQSVFKRASFFPPDNDRLLDGLLENQLERKSTEHKQLKAEPHIGMVGYFGPVVSRIREMNYKLTVLELDESIFTESANFTVTGHAERLTECTHIICSASTLINQSLETLLQIFHQSHCNDDKQRPFIELVGPTSGCFPDPLFKLGIDKVGGSIVSELDATTTKIRKTDPWGSSVRKYALTESNYPGTERLLEQLV